MGAEALNKAALVQGVRSRGPLAADSIAAALRAARHHTDLGAFWSLAAERGTQRAASLDAARERGERLGPLAGATLAVKDSFDLAGLPTTGGLRGDRAPARADAEAVLRLERAGAVAIGKTAMDPLAWSTHGQAPGHPPCLNPLDPRLSPGGSSSGSAVAVAAGLADIGLGTDVAGSVRVPAAYCGIVALKPGLGAIPLEGCLPLAPSFDLVGVMARSVKACATAYEALSGSHLDPDAPIARAAVLTDLMDEADDPVADLCRRAVRRLERSGLGLEPIVLRWRAEGFGLVLAVELARAWGEQADAEPERFPPQILRAIERARGVAPDRYGDAMGALSQVRRELGRRLGGHDVLLCPTVAHRVPTLEAEEVGSSTRFTRIFNALGWPALSVPCGHDEAGRPVSLQIASVRSVSSAVAAARMVESAVGS